MTSQQACICYGILSLEVVALLFMFDEAFGFTRWLRRRYGSDEGSSFNFDHIHRRLQQIEENRKARCLRMSRPLPEDEEIR
jgi:hypothetical protein